MAADAVACAAAVLLVVVLTMPRATPRDEFEKAKIVSVRFTFLGWGYIFEWVLF